MSHESSRARVDEKDENGRASPGGAGNRVLDVIERVGNKIPHPFWLFIALAALVALTSTVLALVGVEVEVPGEDEPVAVQNLLSVEGMREMVTGAVTNFTSFPPLGIVIVVMLGVAVAEGSGLIMAAVRSVVTKVHGRWLTFAVVLTGITGSVASDAVTVILPPLAAMAYMALGRSPLLGIGVGFCSVSAGFNASLVINATDPLLAGISTSAAQIVDPEHVVSPLANIYFTGPSSIFLAAVMTFVLERYVAPRIEKLEWHDPNEAADAPADENSDDAAEFSDLDSMRLSDDERRGLIWAGLATLGFLAVVGAVIAIPGSPLRGEGDAILTGPLLTGISIIIAVMFAVAGVAYGLVTRSISSWADIPEFMTKGMKDLAPVLVLFFAAAQFIAWFDWSNIGTVLAVSGANAIESSGIPTIAVFIALVLMTYGLNLFITSGSAQWTLMAPVVVPAMMLLDTDPGVTQMLFRIGDSASNVITPLNVYFALMLTYLQRYRKDAGVGTLLSMTLPVSVAVLVGWVAFFIIWYAIGLPLGPGVSP